MQDDFVPIGWKCPVCGRVYSPTTSMCFYCGSGEHNITHVNTCNDVTETKVNGVPFSEWVNSEWVKGQTTSERTE